MKKLFIMETMKCQFHSFKEKNKGINLRDKKLTNIEGKD